MGIYAAVTRRTLDDKNPGGWYPEEKITVEFKPENTEIANQLSAWMDFWSPGNHDDRTLAVIF